MGSRFGEHEAVMRRGQASYKRRKRRRDIASGVSHKILVHAAGWRNFHEPTEMIASPLAPPSLLDGSRGALLPIYLCL